VKGWGKGGWAAKRGAYVWGASEVGKRRRAPAHLQGFYTRMPESEKPARARF